MMLVLSINLHFGICQIMLFRIQVLKKVLVVGLLGSKHASYLPSGRYFHS